VLLCATGAKVTDTIRKGIIDIEPYENATEVLMVGNVAALTGNVIFSVLLYTRLQCFCILLELNLKLVVYRAVSYA